MSLLYDVKEKKKKWGRKKEDQPRFRRLFSRCYGKNGNAVLFGEVFSCATPLWRKFSKKRVEFAYKNRRGKKKKYTST